MFSMVVCGDDAKLYSTGSNGQSSGHSEWISAITALEYAAEHGLTDIVLIGDNANVIGAMQGTKNAHGIYKRFKEQAESHCRELGQVRWEWISSEMNPAGEALRELGDLVKLGSTTEAWRV